MAVRTGLHDQHDNKSLAHVGLSANNSGNFCRLERSQLWQLLSARSLTTLATLVGSIAHNSGNSRRLERSQLWQLLSTRAPATLATLVGSSAHTSGNKH